jgi:hypothetical protein
MQFPKQETIVRLGRTFRELTVASIHEDVPSEMSRILARIREIEAQRSQPTRPTGIH